MFNRTLNGANMIDATSLNLPDNVNAVRINGDFGTAGQVIAKDSNNRLNWSRVDEVEIPDNSISGAKLKDDITIDTTGDITASVITATTSFIAPSSTLGFKVGNEAGSAGMVLQKSATNVLQWGLVDDIEIPDNSITGAKLRDDITFTTTSNISANQFIATGNFSQTGTAVNGFNGAIQTSKVTTIGGGVDLFNGGKVDLFTDAGVTRTFDIDGSTGDLKIYNPANGNERIELDGSTGNVIINDGGRIDMFLGATLNIELNGVNGIIDCRGLILRNHTGLITFDRLRCDELNCNTFQMPEDAVNNPEVFAIDASGNITSAGDITLTGAGKDFTLKGGISMGGDLTSLNGDITLTNGDLTVGGDTTLEDITMNGDLTSLNGNITLTNGTLFGNVVGTITEELIDAQRLNLRKDPTGLTAGNTGIVMDVASTETGFIDLKYITGALGYSGIRIGVDSVNKFEVTKDGHINNVGNILFYGGIFNNVNSGRFMMNNNNTIMSNNTSLGNTQSDKLFIQFGGSQDGAEIRIRDNNTDRVKLDEDIRLFNSIQTETIHLVSQTGGIQLDGILDADGDINCGGDINFTTTSGELVGDNVNSPNDIKNMSLMSNTNHMPHPRFVNICDPASHSTYTFGAGVWYNMAGYTANNPAKPRFTNADLTFTAHGSVGRINVIFSSVESGNMGVRFRIAYINGLPTQFPLTTTARLYIGSTAHRGQHEYITYYEDFNVGYSYTIVPEVFCGTGNITMFVGSNSGSATIQNADSPIITEVSFMNNVTVNKNNIYVPAVGGDDY